jgi:hypothetical protein
MTTKTHLRLGLLNYAYLLLPVPSSSSYFGMEAWLKLWSICLTGGKFWVKTPLLPKQSKGPKTLRQMFRADSWRWVEMLPFLFPDHPGILWARIFSSVGDRGDTAVWTQSLYYHLSYAPSIVQNSDSLNDILDLWKSYVPLVIKGHILKLHKNLHQYYNVEQQELKK